MEFLHGHELGRVVARQNAVATLERVLMEMDLSVSGHGATIHWVAHCKPKLKELATQLTERGLHDLTFGELKRDSSGQELYQEAIGILTYAIRLGAKV